MLSMDFEIPSLGVLSVFMSWSMRFIISTISGIVFLESLRFQRINFKKIKVYFTNSKLLMNWLWGMEEKKIIHFDYEISDVGSWINVEVCSVTGKTRRGTGWGQRGYTE